MAVSIEIKDYTAGAKKGNERGALEMIHEACVAVQGQAALLAPVDLGRLKGSISYKTSIAADGELTISPKKYEGYVGTNVEYAVYQEFGTRKMAAQPFLRPAAGVLKGEGQVRRILRENMKQYLDTIGANN